MKELFITNEYTPEMIAELTALSPVDNSKAQAFADKHGLTVHSVRAKAVRTEGIVYARKPKTRKDGSKVESKAEIVANIAETCGSDAESFESLANATRDVLIKVRAALA